MPQTYSCPYGCQPLSSLARWKNHMGKKHGGYSNAELESASLADTSGDVKSRMESFASDIDGVPVTIDESGAVHEIPRPPEPIPIDSLPGGIPGTNTRKVRATPKRVKKVVAGIPTKILEALKITPDTEDTQAIEEAADFLQDVFGFEFEIDESKTVIHSRWWAFAWVAGIIALVYVKHRANHIFNLIEVQPSTSEPNNVQ
jgi:hypothetical protein